jgi:hypothetical protein
MNWTSLRVREPPLHTHWCGDEIVVARGDEAVDRLRADAIGRVTLIHAGAGESPAEVRAALFELPDRVVLLDAASGIVGRVLFERQSYWAQGNCIYWVSDQRVAWPAVAGDSRWGLARPTLPYRRLAPDAAAALIARSDATGPHTWDQRKQFRIERRRLFPGREFGATPTQAGATS